MPAIDITDNNFNTEVLEASEPVLVRFTAPWCGPCRQVAPIVEALSEEYAGRMKFTTVNIDENPTVASRFGVASIPTMMVFKNGEVVKTLTGARPRNVLKEEFDAVL